MKIVITGHTTGIGAALFERFSETNHEVVGLSRSTGFDLGDDLWAFTKETRDADVFINNAHHEYAQAELLKMVTKNNTGRKLIIINMGSISADISHPYHPEYSVQKAALDHMAMLLNNGLSTSGNWWPKIITLRFGMTDTPRTEFFPDPKLDVDDIVRTVEWVLAQPEHVHVTEITLKHFEQTALLKR